MRKLAHNLIHTPVFGLILGFALFLFGLPFFALPDYLYSLFNYPASDGVIFHLIHFTWNTSIFGFNIRLHHIIMMLGMALFIHTTAHIIGRSRPAWKYTFGSLLALTAGFQVFIMTCLNLYPFLRTTYDSDVSSPFADFIFVIFGVGFYTLYYGVIFIVVGALLYFVIRALRRRIHPTISYRLISHFGWILLVAGIGHFTMQSAEMIIITGGIIALVLFVLLMLSSPQREKRKPKLEDDSDEYLPLFIDEKPKRSSLG